MDRRNPPEEVVRRFLAILDQASNCSEMLKLTLDTNCINNLLDFESETPTSVDELSALIRHALEGNVNLCITTVVARDLERDKNDDRRAEMLRKINMFPQIGTVFRLDFSRLGSREFLGGHESTSLDECVRSILAPALRPGDAQYEKRVADIDHVVGHKLAHRDIFVTDDGEILKRASALQTQCRVQVANPREALDLIERSVNRALVAEDFRRKFGEVTRLIV